MDTFDFYPGNGDVQTLSPTDFDDDPEHSWELIKPRKKVTVILFYCAWCKYCREFKDTFAAAAAKVRSVQFASFNCAKYQTYKEDLQNISEWVKGYPTVLFYREGRPIVKYSGSRELETFIKAILLFHNENPIDDAR